MIKPIETEYAEHRFRSRLEARWAVFFDTMNFDWQYEPEAFHVKQGRRRANYLPDFYLPELGVYAEVKGGAGFTKLDVVKICGLCEGADAPVLLLGAIPRGPPHPYPVFGAVAKLSFGPPQIHRGLLVPCHRCGHAQFVWETAADELLACRNPDCDADPKIEWQAYFDDNNIPADYWMDAALQYIGAQYHAFNTANKERFGF